MGSKPTDGAKDRKTMASDEFGSRLVLDRYSSGDEWIDFIPADKHHDAPFLIGDSTKTQLAEALDAIPRWKVTAEMGDAVAYAIGYINAGAAFEHSAIAKDNGEAVSGLEQLLALLKGEKG